MKTNLKKLLDSFGIEYRDFGNRLTGCCPIHSGDNKTAFCIYTENGIWRCFTGGCHQKHKGVINLTKLLIEKKTGKPCSYNEARQTFENITSLEIKFNDGINYSFLKKFEKEKPKLTREKVLSHLEIPAPYFLLERGFSEEILIKYDVGTSHNKKSKFCGRAVVPIYDLDYKYMVGFTARTTNGGTPKWLHDNFKRDLSLYNSWFAKTEIAETNTCILVESPGNIWRLEEAGIHCGLAMYGTNLGFGQMRLLAQLGVLNIVLALDNDEAGKKATGILVERLKGLYNIVIPKIDYGDLAECPKNYLKMKMSESLDELK